MFTLLLTAALAAGAEPERPAVRFTVSEMTATPPPAAPVVDSEIRLAQWSTGPVLRPYGGFGLLTASTDPPAIPPEPAKEEPEPVKSDPVYFAQRLLNRTCAGCLLQEHGIQVFGWTAGNFTGSSARVSNAPVTFNDFANAGQMNQNWLEVTKTIDTEKKEHQWGFRYAAILPGTDARYTIARGLGNPSGDYPIDPMTYGYGELFLPGVGPEGTTFRLGKWGSPITYEYMDAVKTPFVSKSYIFQNTPFTHTGLLATTGLGNGWTAYSGVCTGADVFLDPAGTPTFVGGIEHAPKDGRNSIAFHFMVNNATYNVAEQFVNYDCFNMIYTHKFTDRLNYVLDAAYCFSRNVPNVGTAEWFGFANYLNYQHCNEKLVSTMRAEIFQDSQGFRTGTQGTYFEWTYGIAWKPRDWMIVRPFARYDWNRNAPFEGNANLYTGGVEVILRW